MKHLLLPLLLLTPLSLFPGDGAASATPAAGAAAGGVAGAPAEGEAKRGKADVKSDPALLSLDEVNQRVIPAVSEHIPTHLAHIVAESLVERKNLVPLYAQRAMLLESYLLKWALEIAEPKPSWRSVRRSIIEGFQAHQVPFLDDLAQIVGDYAQGDHPPVEEIFNWMTAPRTQLMIGAFSDAGQELYEEAQSRIFTRRGEQFRDLKREYGRVYAYGAQMLKRWQEAGFERFAKEHLNEHETDTMTCRSCLTLYAACGLLKGQYVLPAGLQGYIFGEIYGTAFAWRNPFHYHRSDCAVLAGLKEKNPQLSSDNPPVFRTDPKKFAEYILLQCDLLVRKRLGERGTPINLRDATEPVTFWMSAMNGLALVATPLSQGIAAFVEDPHGWVDRENARAQELGLSIRYPRPQKEDQPK